jgi:hypothetical protein
MSGSTVSSTPILRTTLLLSAVATIALVVIGGVIGFAIAGSDGMWSALAGVLLAAVFLAITAISILIANRWYGQDLYVQLFFAIVLGGWILKFIVFIVVLLVLREQPWVVPTIFFVALVVGILTSLVIDVVVMLRMRIPYVSDITLPGEEPGEGDTPRTSSADS